MTRRAALALFALFFGGFGAYALIDLGASAYYAERARTWPTVAGLITEARLRSNGRRGPGNGASHMAIAYTYEVDGVAFVGDRYQFADNYFYARKQEVILSLNGEPRRDVYFDPSNPARSVLRPGVNLISLLVGGAAGLLFLSIGAIVGAWALRKR